MKKVSVWMMSMVMVLSLAACGGGGDEGNSGEAAESAAATITVLLEIDYPDESGVADVEDASVEIPEGGTVMDAINTYADANDCEIIMSEASSTPYITSIGGVAATDTAGWVYEINDEMVMESADAYVLSANDEVSWSFETWGE